MPESCILGTESAGEDLQKRLLFWLAGPRKVKWWDIYYRVALRSELVSGAKLLVPDDLSLLYLASCLSDVTISRLEFPYCINLLNLAHNILVVIKYQHSVLPLRSLLCFFKGQDRLVKGRLLRRVPHSARGTMMSFTLIVFMTRLLVLV